MRVLISAVVMFIFSPLLAVAYIVIRFAIELRLRRRRAKRDPLAVTFKHSTRASRRAFNERLDEQIFAVTNKGVTVL